MFLMITKIIVTPYMCGRLWVHKPCFLGDEFGFSQEARMKATQVAKAEAPWGVHWGVFI